MDELLAVKSTLFAEFKMKILKNFESEFMNVYPGDSGIGGNTPQDPVRELNTNDPDEIMIFISRALDEVPAFVSNNFISCDYCTNCVCGDNYENQHPESEKDEFFCSEECENNFHEKNR